MKTLDESGNIIDIKHISEHGLFDVWEVNGGEYYEVTGECDIRGTVSLERKPTLQEAQDKAEERQKELTPNADAT